MTVTCRTVTSAQQTNFGHAPTPNIFGRWGHSVENYQQLPMHFIISRYLQEKENVTSAGQVSERWRLAKEQYSRSARSTVRAIRAMMSTGMTNHTDEEIMQTL
jgi:hypothetical protein